MTVTKARELVKELKAEQKEGRDIYKRALTSLRRRYRKPFVALLFDFLQEQHEKRPDADVVYALAIKIFVRDRGESCFFCSLYLATRFCDDDSLQNFAKGKRWAGCCNNNPAPLFTRNNDALEGG